MRACCGGRRGARLVALDAGHRAPRRQGADRHPTRGRLRRLHGGERDRGHARGRRCSPARALGQRQEPAPSPTSASRTGSWRSPRATAWSRPGLAGRAAKRTHAPSALLAPLPDLRARSARPARWRELKDGALKVWSHCQGPAVLRDWLARALGLADFAGHRVPPPGRRLPTGTTPPTTRRSMPLFIATRMPGRTVRVQWSREDEFPSAPISTAMAIELRAVLDTDNPTGRLDHRAFGARRTPSVRA